MVKCYLDIVILSQTECDITERQVNYDGSPTVKDKLI